MKGAEGVGLEVVPLVQTFGHLEFALKNAAFEALRECPDGFMDLCPLHPDAIALVAELISQVGALPGLSRPPSWPSIFYVVPVAVSALCLGAMLCMCVSKL